MIGCRSFRGGIFESNVFLARLNFCEFNLPGKKFFYLLNFGIWKYYTSFTNKNLNKNDYFLRSRRTKIWQFGWQPARILKNLIFELLLVSCYWNQILSAYLSQKFSIKAYCAFDHNSCTPEFFSFNNFKILPFLNLPILFLIILPCTLQDFPFLILK